jgi:multisubunit Na+/H+ antiporter MnhB subunit
MSVIEWAFDLTLALTLLVLGWKVLSVPNLFHGIVLFIAFGLLLALGWARLEAPDVALAEAAVGAGITGVLLLYIQWQMEESRPGDERDQESREGHWVLRWLLYAPVTLSILLLAIVLVQTVLLLPRAPLGLTGTVRDHLALSGVIHPVTAVLLNFRSYDTLLELGVLLAAIMGTMNLRREKTLFQKASPRGAELVLLWTARWIIPLIVLCAGYLLWLGKFAAGGAFQAGVVLGAGGILLWMAGFNPFARCPDWLGKTLLLAGFGFFLLVGMAVIPAGFEMFQYPAAWAEHLILLIELAAMISIGLTLAGLFILAQPPENRGLQRETPP